MKTYEFPLGPERPKRFPRKLKKRVINEFGRDVYYQAKIGYIAIKKYRPPLSLTSNGIKSMPADPKKIGTLENWMVLWDVFNGEQEEYEKSITRKRR